jgi:8-oxo-dGTP pyrophosphatase MutT (NUDIX family)
MNLQLFIATKAFIVFDKKVLLLRESATYTEGTNNGRYDVPGGRLELGEKFDHALVREVKEETGLHIEIGDPLGVLEWRPNVHRETWQIIGIYFLCTTNSNAVVLSNDHDRYVWIDPREYKRYNLVGELPKLFEKYLSAC